MTSRHGTQLWLSCALVLAVSSAATAQNATSPHTVTTTKFTIDDVSISKTFYEDLVGMPELRRFVAEGRLVEPFMGWTENGRMGLLAYTEKETVKKSPYPVSVVFLPNLDEVAARFEAAGQPFQVLSQLELLLVEGPRHLKNYVPKHQRRIKNRHAEIQPGNR